MYTSFVRILLCVLGLGLGYFYFQKGSDLAAVLMLTAVALIVWGYFKNGTVYLAFRKIKKEKFEEAEKILHQTKYPNLLKSQQRGFYHFTKAMIAANRNDSEDAKTNFTEALKYGVRTENNVAIINLNLANIEVENRNFAAAEEYLQKIRGLKLGGQVEAEILKLESKIADSKHGQ